MREDLGGFQRIIGIALFFLSPKSMHKQYKVSAIRPTRMWIVCTKRFDAKGRNQFYSAKRNKSGKDLGDESSRTLMDDVEPKLYQS